MISIIRWAILCSLYVLVIIDLAKTNVSKSAQTIEPSLYDSEIITENDPELVILKIADSDEYKLVVGSNEYTANDLRENTELDFKKFTKFSIENRTIRAITGFQCKTKMKSVIRDILTSIKSIRLFRVGDWIGEFIFEDNDFKQIENAVIISPTSDLRDICTYLSKLKWLHINYACWHIVHGCSNIVKIDISLLEYDENVESLKKALFEHKKVHEVRFILTDYKIISHLWYLVIEKKWKSVKIDDRYSHRHFHINYRLNEINGYDDQDAEEYLKRTVGKKEMSNQTLIIKLTIVASYGQKCALSNILQYFPTTNFKQLDILLGKKNSYVRLQAKDGIITFNRIPYIFVYNYLLFPEETSLIKVLDDIYHRVGKFMPKLKFINVDNSLMNTFNKYLDNDSGLYVKNITILFEDKLINSNYPKLENVKHWRVHPITKKLTTKVIGFNLK